MGNENAPEITNIAVGELVPATYNPRRISEAELAKVRDSVEEFGMVDPIVVNDDMTVIGGHQRLKAAISLGWETVPCIVLSLSKKDEKRLNIKLNRLGGQFDEELLKDVLMEFDEAELPELGFEPLELEKIMGDKDLSEANKEVGLDDLGKPKNVTCPDCGCEFEP